LHKNLNHRATHGITIQDLSKFTNLQHLSFPNINNSGGGHTFLLFTNDQHDHDTPILRNYFEKNKNLKYFTVDITNSTCKKVAEDAGFKIKKASKKLITFWRKSSAQ